MLVAIARRRERISYSGLGAILGLPTRGPHWKVLLDDLSLNEPEGAPELAVLVVAKATGLPSPPAFGLENPKDPAERKRIEALQEAVWRHYAVKGG